MVIRGHDPGGSWTDRRNSNVVQMIQFRLSEEAIGTGLLSVIHADLWFHRRVMGCTLATSERNFRMVIALKTASR